MVGRLQDKVAIVTGAGSRGPGIGNGRATAVLFAREGARVLLVDGNASAAEETLRIIHEEGGDAQVLVGDVTNAEDCAGMVATALDRWGGLHILHNNVGIGLEPATVVDMEEADWERIHRVNVTSMMLTSKYAVPVMARAGGGSITNVSSIAALRPRGSTAYSTTKGAVVALTQAMAADHGAAGIRVNCIMPGPIFTPMVGGERMPPEVRERRRVASLLEIEGTGWDIGWAAVYLNSDEARYVTGVVLPVDGGVLIRGPARG